MDVYVVSNISCNEYICCEHLGIGVCVAVSFHFYWVQI